MNFRYCSFAFVTLLVALSVTARCEPLLMTTEEEIFRLQQMVGQGSSRFQPEDVRRDLGEILFLTSGCEAVLELYPPGVGVEVPEVVCACMARRCGKKSFFRELYDFRRRVVQARSWRQLEKILRIRPKMEPEEKVVLLRAALAGSKIVYNPNLVSRLESELMAINVDPAQ